MNNANRQAIADAEARYAAAVASGDIGAKRQAMLDRIATKTASMPRVDHNGTPLPDAPEPPATPAEPSADPTAGAMAVLALLASALNPPKAPAPPSGGDDTDPGGSSLPAAA